MRFWSLLFVAQVAALLSILAAETSASTEGKSLLPTGTAEAAKLVCGADVKSASMKIVDVSHAGFQQAWKITIPERAKRDRDIEFKLPVLGSVHGRDVLFVEFWARMLSSNDESGEARGLLMLEQNHEPYAKSILGFPWSAGMEWRHITLPTRAGQRLVDGEAVLSIRLGGPAQTLEIGGLSVRNYGQNYDISKLPPALAITYKGREPGAEWRKAAAERIDKYRKAELRVHVVDKAGNPVPNSSVAVKLVRHAFKFSSAIAAKDLLASEAEEKGSDRYRQMIPKLFNMATMESDLKWLPWENDRNRTLQAVDWTRQHGLILRGHCVIWPSWGRMPGDLPSLAHDPAAMRKRIFDHETDILTATGEKIDDWDIVNEPQANHDVMDSCGDSIMIDLYQTARKLHPSGRLYLNEALNFSTPDKLQRLEEMALDLRRRGAPIDGLGLQSHYAWSLTPPEKIVATLDHLAKLGFSLQITEFDIDVTDEQLQADYLRDFFTAAFSEPAVDAIQMWGFWEGRHWRPNAALWRSDWSIKPSGQAYLDLMKQWDTQETLTTDSEGDAEVRGFLGEYEITARRGAEGAVGKFMLTKDGGLVDLVLGPDHAIPSK